MTTPPSGSSRHAAAPRRVAIVHEWLAGYRGSERVVEQLLRCYPQAQLFATVDLLGAEERGFLHGRRAQTTFIQHLPLARRYQAWLPLMPLAVEQHDLEGYDLVLSSHHSVAKGVLTGPDQLHLCYCHTPMRYAWDLQHQYLRSAGLDRGLRGVLVGWPVRWLLHRLRQWDVRTANGVDAFMANSAYIARRIWKVYRRRATVIYPPVAVEDFSCQEEKAPFYVTAGRMVPYKQVELVVRAFAAMPERQLVVIGDGPTRRQVHAAAGPNVTFLGEADGPTLRAHLQRARAFVFAGEEDFGILPVEAQACGTPVIAYQRGGVAESVRGLEHPQPTGVFFGAQTPEAIQGAVAEFERQSHRISARACRENAERFSADRFRAEFTAFVEAAWARFQAGRAVDDAPPGLQPTEAE